MRIYVPGEGVFEAVDASLDWWSALRSQTVTGTLARRRASATATRPRDPHSLQFITIFPAFDQPEQVPISRFYIENIKVRKLS